MGLFICKYLYGGGEMPKILTVLQGKVVQGVKGNAEAAYRNDYVNITSEDIGFGIVVLENPSGTLSTAELNVLKNNLHNYIGYAPENDGVYIFRLAVKNFATWIYSATEADLSGSMFVSVNTTTGAYNYSTSASETQTELEQHEADAEVHVSAEDRTSWDSKVSASVEPVGGGNDDNILILS